jgi:hypothetical protein
MAADRSSTYHRVGGISRQSCLLPPGQTNGYSQKFIRRLLTKEHLEKGFTD